MAASEPEAASGAAVPVSPVLAPSPVSEPMKPLEVRLHIENIPSYMEGMTLTMPRPCQITFYRGGAGSGTQDRHSNSACLAMPWAQSFRKTK